MRAAVTRLAVLLAVPASVAAAWLGLSLTQAPLTTVDLNRGARVFEQRCASCHTLDREHSSPYGPNLGNIGAIAAERVPSQSAEEYLLQSIINPDAFRNPGEHGVMPADISGGLKPTELTSLVGFLVQHGGALNWSRLLAITKHAKSVEADTVERTRLAYVESGKAIYLSKAKCNTCHPLQATPGGTLRAPSLVSAGQHSPQYLLESIQRPSRAITQGYSNWSVWLEDGRVFSGRIVRSTPEEIELITDRQGEMQLVAINREDILLDEEEGEGLRQMPHSMMPDNLASSLTEQETKQLVAFLRTLK